MLQHFGESDLYDELHWAMDAPGTEAAPTSGTGLHLSVTLCPEG